MNPDLRYKQYVLNKLVSDLEGFLVYYNPQFKSWWWINPDTKEWRFEFKDSGTLYWFYGWGDNFISKYSLEESEFEEVISRYVEHTLQNGVVNTTQKLLKYPVLVEHTLQNGVINTNSDDSYHAFRVEDTLQNGVINTRPNTMDPGFQIDHTLQNGITKIIPTYGGIDDEVIINQTINQ